MFNDRYGLTRAVLEGQKTMTRRVISKEKYPLLYSWQQNRLRFEILGNDTLRVWYKADPQSLRTVDHFDIRIPRQVGEVVAVAQSYREMGYNPRDTKQRSGEIWGLDHAAGWTNKMFVCASECKHQIRITNVRVERLQYISEEDCLREGIVEYTCNLYEYRGICYSFEGDKTKMGTHKSPREAFAGLIDKVSGKGTWASNPWVFVYEFELVK